MHRDGHAPAQKANVMSKRKHDIVSARVSRGEELRLALILEALRAPRALKLARPAKPAAPRRPRSRVLVPA
jgi:hypothetical protein